MHAQGEVGKEILCDSNKGFKQRDWNQDVKQTECMIDALTTHVQQQHREVRASADRRPASLLDEAVHAEQG